MEFPVVLVKLNEIHNLNEVAQKLLVGNVMDARPEKVEWPPGDTLHKQWRTSGDTFGVNRITLNDDTEFQYIFVNALVERAKLNVKDEHGEFLDRADRINKVESDVLFFQHDNNVYAALYMNLTKNNSKVNYILKDLMVESIWGKTQLLPSDYHINDDIYYWILSKFLVGDKVICDEPQKLTIEGFTGYSGTTTDTLHSMTGEGENVAALLGTLAFIFNEDSLKALKMHVNMDIDGEKSDNIIFELSSLGNIRIIEYDVNSNINNIQQEKILITLIVYKKIIPYILTQYEKCFKEGQWNQEKKQEFINVVGKIILERVTKALENNRKISNSMQNKIEDEVI